MSVIAAAQMKSSSRQRVCSPKIWLMLSRPSGKRRRMHSTKVSEATAVLLATPTLNTSISSLMVSSLRASNSNGSSGTKPDTGSPNHPCLTASLRRHHRRRMKRLVSLPIFRRPVSLH